MTADQHAMISIKPGFASSILSGAKTIELRRRFFDLSLGSKLWIYSTLPVGAVVGVATLDSFDRDTPQNLWRRYEGRTQIEVSDFNDYFHGCETGVALGLSDIYALEPVDLKTIREIRGIASMPQVAVKITSEQAASLGRIGACGNSLRSA
ncbi:MAG: hypothetical protein ACSHWY_00495 [Octadecabacter sp.]